MRSICAVLIALSIRLIAQSPSTFEAASIRDADSASRWVFPPAIDPQRFHALTIVPRLIEWAWEVRDFQVLGLPGWLAHERF